MTPRFDHLFQRFTAIYFEDLVSWPWFKAQALAESNLNPAAISHCGARGLMQLMPATSAELAAELGLPDHPFNPELNIRMGIYYMRKLWSIWKKEQGLERLRFALASYNAGAGNIIKAQRLAKKSDRWHSLAVCLPGVTGKNARETINYIKRIERLRLKMINV